MAKYLRRNERNSRTAEVPRSPHWLWSHTNPLPLQHATPSLAQQEPYFQRLLTNNPLPAWLVEVETLAIIDVNTAAIMAYGYSRAEFLQLHMDDIQPQDEVRRFLADLNSTGLVLPHFGQWHHHTKDGHLVVTELTAYLVEFAARPVALVIAHNLAVPTQSDTPHESDERSRALFTHSPEGILLTALDGQILAANPAACRMLQRTEAELCRLGRDGVLKAYDAANMIAERQRTGYFRGELQVLRADGNAFSADISTARFRDKEGQERAVIFFRDVSDRQQAEKAFQESYSLFRSFMNNSPAAAYIKDATGHYVYINALTEQILGRKRGGVVGKTDSDLWPDETARKVRETDTTVFERTLPVKVEESAELTDGIHHWLSFKFPIAVPDRRLLGGMSVDITERLTAEAALRQANSELESRIVERTRALIQANADLLAEVAARRRVEETLRISEDRYRIISQSISDYAFSFRITEDDTVFFDWLTDNFVQITGYPVEEILGKRNPFDNYIHPEDLSHIKRTIRILVPDRPVTYEYRLIRKDGALRWLQVYLQRIPHNQDNTIRIHGAAQDITERKQAQEEIERLNQTLEQHVSELSDLNQDLESFSYSVSHDLRAPLRHIQGFVDLLHQHLKGTLDDKGRRYLEILTQAAKRMGALIDDLLAFSRTARAEVRTTRVNLTQIVQEVLLDLSEETATRKIVWDIDPLPEAYGDVALLRIVMTNLLGNAVKYTRPRSTPRITIGCTAATAKESVYFVRDNGVGFDMQYSAKLFGVFQRLHRDDEFEGTGIGLATVHRIVRRLGGRVWAAGELDRGATFSFSLPTVPRGTER
jgi:PAS domain S-box-containing protein